MTSLPYVAAAPVDDFNLNVCSLFHSLSLSISLYHEMSKHLAWMGPSLAWRRKPNRLHWRISVGFPPNIRSSFGVRHNKARNAEFCKSGWMIFRGSHLLFRKRRRRRWNPADIHRRDLQNSFPVKVESVERKTVASFCMCCKKDVGSSFLALAL